MTAKSKNDCVEDVAMQVLSFQEMMKALDHLPTIKQAAIQVHDDLDVARSIAKHLFGDGYDPDLVFRIRALLVEEEVELDASSIDTDRRIGRSEIK